MYKNEIRRKDIKKKIFKLKRRSAYEISRKVGAVVGSILLGLMLFLSMLGGRK